MTMMPMIMSKMKQRMSLSVAMRRMNARIYEKKSGEETRRFREKEEGKKGAQSQRTILSARCKSDSIRSTFL